MGAGSEHDSHPVTVTMFVLFVNHLSPAGGCLGTAGSFVLSTSLHAPVEDVVILIAFANEEVTEELAKVGIVRLVIEAQCPGVVQEDTKFVGEATAKEISGGGHLLLHDTVILLLLGGSFEALPRQGTAKEVHENVGEGFKIIAARLLNTQMSIDGGVTGGAGQVLVLPIGDVKVRLRVTEFLRKTKIDDIDLVSTLANPHQEVIRLNVAVNEVP
jgi:hypothetical protein